MTDVPFSTRWFDSGGAFGYYDNVMKIFNLSKPEAFKLLSLDLFGELSSVNLSTTNGLNNTLFVSGTAVKGTTIEVSLAQEGKPFDADVTLGGEVTASLAGFDVDLASFEMNSDEVRLTIGIDTKTYSRINLQELDDDLIRAGVDEGVADVFVEDLRGVFNLIGKVEDAVLAFARSLDDVDQSQGLGPIICPLNLLSVLSMGRRKQPWDDHRQRVSAMREPSSPSIA